MESITARNELVNKLVQKIQIEYEAERNRFLQLLQFDVESVAQMSSAELDSNVDYIAYRTGVLAWIKRYILDNNGQLFRRYISSDGNDNAIFHVHTDCIQILLECTNTVAHIASRFSPKASSLHELFNIDETNLDRIFVSVLEYAAHRRSKESES